MSPVELEMIILYDRGTRLQKMIQREEDPARIERARARLLKRWEKARKMGLQDEVFDRCLTAVHTYCANLDICGAYRNQCANCKDKKSAKPCEFADHLSECGPFCPHFKERKES